MDPLAAIGGPGLFRVGDACRFLGIGRSRFYELVGEGQIELVKIGKASFVRRTFLEDFVRNLPRLANRPKPRT